MGILRSTFRDPATGKIKHQQHGRLVGLSLSTLLNVQAALRDDVLPKNDPAAFKILSSREFGASAALLALAKDIGLDRALYSKTTLPWVRDTLAMIIGRILYQGSKLFLSHQWKNTSLWELCGVMGPVDVDEHCYEPLDRLLERQNAIQQTLAKTHLTNGCIVLYDITSTYFEGEYEDSWIVQFGYNRDGKRGHEQVVIGLLTNAEGCPVAVEVFPGNTQDAATVEGKVKELRERYGVSEIVLVGDRGMITASNEEKLAALPEAEGLKIISALTHRQMVELLERTAHQPELFDDRNIVEIADPANPGHRYCLCRNPHSAARETATREALLDRTRQELTRIAGRKKRASAEVIGAQVGRLLAKTHMGKHLKWQVSDGKLEWSIDEESVAAAKALDGCYVIKTTVSAAAMNKDEVVKRYKSLSRVEQAFRNMKTVSLELRPVHHKTDERIRAHVFLCMLAYYLQWHFTQRLAPLFEQQQAALASGVLLPKNRTLTLAGVLESLKNIRRNEVSVGEASFHQLTEPGEEQQQILKLLRIKLSDPM
ncbi:MAG: IS1634 family transposase [Thermoleophilia bacterium]